MTFKEAVKTYVQTLLTGRIMTADPGEASIAGLVEAWVLLKYTKEALEDRLAALRVELLKRAGDFGRPTDKGGQLLKVKTSTVLRERREPALPPGGAIRKLLAEKGIDEDKAFSKQTTIVLDASKLAKLIDEGHLDEKEVKALKKITWALRVKEGAPLAESLDRLVGPPEPETTGEPREKRETAVGPRKGE